MLARTCLRTCLRIGIGLRNPARARALARSLATCTAVAGALAGGSAGAGPAPDMHPRFEAALERYERGHYEAAFDELAALADDGHCEAARIAYQMAREGRALYPVAFRVEPGRLRRWRQREGCPATALARP
jgi:hypothetical protein